MLIVLAVQPDKTHKIKTLNISEDNERLQLILRISECIITDPQSVPYLLFALLTHDGSLKEIESFHQS